MTIIQGSNTPLTVQLPPDCPVEGLNGLVASLYKGLTTALLKGWTLDDITITPEDNTIDLPLTEEDTMGFDENFGVLELKWLDADSGIVEHAYPGRVWIAPRINRDRMVSDNGR